MGNNGPVEKRIKLINAIHAIDFFYSISTRSRGADGVSLFFFINIFYTVR